MSQRSHDLFCEHLPVNTHLPSRIRSLMFHINIIAAIFICSSPACASITDPKPQSTPDPFALFVDVPMSIDAAAVFNNPAQQFLLSNSGRIGRKILSLTGVFSNTQHAFDALADAFDTSTDELIKAFFSQRVIVMWDSIAASDSAFGLANAMDTNWTIACEVEPEYIQQIRLHLKPIRRSIEHGQTIYAIEKGRYELVLLNNDHLRSNQSTSASMIILAPKRGAKLLDQVLESFVANPNQPPKKPQSDQSSTLPNRQSIIHTREKLIASIETQNVPWSAAWIIQLDRFMNTSPSVTTQDHDTQQSSTNPAAVGLLNITAGKISASFSTDINLNFPKSDAPVGLLSAVGGDAILAIVMSKTPTLFVDQDMVQFLFSLSSSESTTQSKDQSMYPDGPGLILLAKIPDNQSDKSSQASARNSKHAMPIAVTLMTQLDQANEDQTPAINADQIMHNLFHSIDSKKAPAFQGKFPNVIRSHTFETPSQTPQKTKPTTAQSTWPGQFANISWVSSSFARNQVLITSLAPQYADTTSRVRWVVEAARNLDAIPSQQGQTGIVMSGYIRPNQMIPLFESSDSANALNIGMLKLVDRVEWEIARSPVGLRGTTSIELASFGNITKLGTRKR